MEKSKGGQEKNKVLTDHFSRYAQAIPTRNQKASTTAEVLYENLFLHYGFQAVLHSDKGANFESNGIRKLCEIAEVKNQGPLHTIQCGMGWWSASTKRFSTYWDTPGRLKDRLEVSYLHIDACV